ncbi:MAG: CBS and ACT domain-containing protein [Desulfovibrio sp.]|jgi:acetoin utilization protein AcuB|nr:CBS and ACT domain-containing protein [Desulfovibrio sp.]
MLVKNWMTPQVHTITTDTSMLKMGRMMKEHAIHRLPVVDDRRHVVGIVSDSDIRDASPSKATTLGMHEMNYLLAELTAKDIMTARPLTVKPSDSVEKAAMLMLDNTVGGLPVVDDDGVLVGIITDHDVFKALVNITGVREGGLQIGVDVPNEQGAMRPVFDVIRSFKGRILSVLSTNNQEGRRQVFVRIRPLDTKEEEEALIAAVGEKAGLLYWSRREAEN